MFFIFATIALVSVLLYLWHIEKGLGAVPEEVRKLASPPWTKEQVLKAYDVVSARRIDFQSQVPPKLDRRYVIVGGSGLVGGHVILHLLARGQTPASIRNVDSRPPVREDLVTGEARKIGFAQADITSEDSMRAALEAPWPKEVANLPLTVFHIAAKIEPFARKSIFDADVNRINVLGTANVVAASKLAGADVFVATSSGSIALRPLEIWFPPWRKQPRNIVQVYPDADQDVRLRPQNDYFGIYAASKARAEEIVLGANTKDFKTGCIRPSCGVYGNKYDLNIGQYMKIGTVPTWVPHIVNSFVHAENVSLAHLLYEAALLSHPASTSGKAFSVSDPGPAPRFGDLYFGLSTLCLTGFRAPTIPATPIVLLAYVFEAYFVLRELVPGRLGRRFLPAFSSSLWQVQPALVNICGVHQIASNAQAALSPARGGIGYVGAGSTMEGLAQEVKMWNDEVIAEGKRRVRQDGIGLVEEAKKVPDAAAAVAGVKA